MGMMTPFVKTIPYLVKSSLFGEGAVNLYKWGKWGKSTTKSRAAANQ